MISEAICLSNFFNCPFALSVNMTLYFITLDNEVKHINRDVKDLGYKDVAKNDYRIKLDDVECRVDRETWNYIWDWLSWH